MPKLEGVIDASPVRRRHRGRARRRSADAAQGRPRLDELLARASPELRAAETSADDVAFWLYSSGSTGRPKGAMHLHSHLLQTAALYAQGVLGMRADDVVFSAAKLFFAYGLGNALTFPLSVGATAVLLAERPTPHAVLRVLAAHQPTVFCGVPTLFASLLADPGRGAVGGARRRCGAASRPARRCRRHVGEKWKARFGTDILDGIGSTEMLHIFLSNRPGDVRYGTTGRPVPGYEVKLRRRRRRAGRRTARRARCGCAGRRACVGYWNQREKSLATFHGPWTRTGDRYVRDATAAVHVLPGAPTTCSRWAASGSSPFEVETALAAHEAVLEAAVVGHADADGLIKPKAFVVLKDAARASEELKRGAAWRS